MRPHLMNLTAHGELTEAQEDVDICDEYIEAGTQGLIVDVFHTSAGAATIVYKIMGYHYTADRAEWTQSFTTLLTSAAIAKDTGTRLVVDPRVAAVTNTHAQTVLPYRIKVQANVGAATATGVFVGVTQAP
jgi:hypothetical protein